MWGTAILISAVSFLLFWAWQFLNWVWLKPKKMEKFLRKQGMKGTSYRFLLGDAKDTIRMYEDAYARPISLRDDTQPRLMPNISQYFKKYGDFCFSWAGPRPRIFVLDPSAAKEVLNKYVVYVKHYKLLSEALRMITTGLVEYEGEKWASSRAKLNPAFKLDKLRPLVPAIEKCSEEILSEWRDLAAKGGGSCVVDVFPYMEVLTSGVLARLIFNMPYTEKIKTTFLNLGQIAFLSKVHSRILYFPGEKYLPTKMNRKINAMHNVVVESLTEIINERLEKNKKANQDDDGYKDLLDLVMEELYNENLSEKDRKRIIAEVIGQLKIFFFAGFETSSVAVTWALILLSLHQDVQARAREEALRVLGDKKEITSDDLAQLKYITMIMNETLRLYPSIMELTRMVNEDTKIKDYIVPKGSLLTLPLLMIHRNPEIWGKDAGEFRPERFADGVAKAVVNGENALMPFGWGPRICLGMNFATMEAKLLLANFLRQFSFELSPTYTHAPVVAITIQPQHGAPLVLKKL